jgi:glutamate-1-semialdehyde 2,1-aminomutase
MKTHLPPASGDTFRLIEEDAMDLAAYRRRMAELLPGRRVAGGLILPGAISATGDQRRSQNEFVSAEVAGDRGWRGAMLVSPDMDAEYVRGEVHRLGLSGLKCYHLKSGKAVTWDADIPDYLPEAQVRVAHEERLFITLHMVKARAVADPSNQRWIRHYCETYPHMQLILAHAARGFNPNHTIEGLAALTGLPNLWCDMSGIADGGACETIIELLGHDRLLFGTDFPVSHLRGRCVAIGDGFVWLYEDTLDWQTVSFQPLQPVFIGLESLRILKQAARHQRLTDRQIEDVFSGNIRRLHERLGN